MSRNRNNSMIPMPDIRDNYYSNGPTPASFVKEQGNNCLFNNDNYKKVTSDNSVNFDSSVNTVQQMNFKQSEYLKPNFIDNNVRSDAKENYEKEISLVIDSIDRDLDIYPNSFDFRVKFNPSSAEKQPFIDKKIENIKEIILENVILPNFFKLEKVSVDVSSTAFDADIITILNASLTPTTDVEFNNSTTPGITAGNQLIIIWYKQTGTNITIDFFDVNDTLAERKVYSAVVDVTTAGAFSVTTLDYYTYEIDSPEKLSEDRFIVMNIDELKNIDEYSTDNSSSLSFGTLLHDGIKCNDKACYMHSCSSKLEFQSSNLRNFSTLSIKLSSSVGDDLTTETNKNFDITNKTKSNQYSGTTIKYVSASKYIRHPLYIHSQCHFIFRIKYLSPSINKINFN